MLAIYELSLFKATHLWLVMISTSLSSQLTDPEATPTKRHGKSKLIQRHKNANKEKNSSKITGAYGDLTGAYREPCRGVFTPIGVEFPSLGMTHGFTVLDESMHNALEFWLLLLTNNSKQALLWHRVTVIGR